MTWAVGHPQRKHWRRSAVITPSGSLATVRPLGASLVGVLSVVAAGWGAISVFWGPDFGYRPTSSGAWTWTMQNWPLHLIPGGVGVAAGLLVVTLGPQRRALLGLASLLLMAAGTWFVIGPAVWPTFRTTAAFSVGAGAWTSWLDQLGSSLGPGLLLAMFGGMALKAGIARPAVAVIDPPTPSPPTEDSQSA